MGEAGNSCIILSRGRKLQYVNITGLAGGFEAITNEIDDILSYSPFLWFWKSWISAGFGQITFLYLSYDNVVFLLSLHMVWITLANIKMLDQSCMSRINSSWFWCRNLCKHHCIQFVNICSRFLCDHEKCLSSVFFSLYLCLALVSGWCWSHRMSGRIFLLFLSSENFAEIYSFLPIMFGRIFQWLSESSTA